MKLNQIVDSIIAQIKELPDGTRIFLTDLMPEDIELTTWELFDVHNEVINKLKLENIELDYNEFKDQIVGLPFSVPFVIKKI